LFKISLQGKRFKSALSAALLVAVATVLIINFSAPKEQPVYPTRSITIPEGYNSFQVDRLLYENRIINEEGSFASLNPSFFSEYWFLEGAETLEGFLFPDTYEFYEQSSPKVVARKFLENWNEKAAVLFISKGSVLSQLTAASIIEKEIPNNQNERAIAAGIVYKRIKEGMPLQMDATLCYIKDKFGCGRVIPSDKEADSPYNTYKNKGLPPGPISNPGLSAIKAAIFPKSSEYWYFISDPKTGKTVFAKTLDEHTQNIVKYLR
jgi:UPF0755 protein